MACGLEARSADGESRSSGTVGSLVCLNALAQSLHWLGRHALRADSGPMCWIRTLPRDEGGLTRTMVLVPYAPCLCAAIHFQLLSRTCCCLTRMMDCVLTFADVVAGPCAHVTAVATLHRHMILLL